ncbi:MAG: putative LPS assembly protein LptD [Bacteroidia bacterium]|nr:putative LPS assembly protein LptD [Bacteroidia bacterium]
MKQLIAVLYLLIATTLFPQLSFSQTRTLSNDSLRQQNDTIAADSISVQEKLEAPVFYNAKDSMVFTKGNLGYLYGDADVKYGDLAIKGEHITMNLDSSVISSTFGLDSVGKEFGYPVFTQGGTEYEMKRVRYNFDSGKAFISNVITQQGEGHIVANTAKKNADNSFYMVNAKYTTCDLHDHPHFFLNLSKAKVRPGKDVVTGPAWLVVADVPLFPIVLPFAFFPFTDTYSSGIIMPSYGDEMERGFYLQNGGYYFAINDYVDLALTGEIYTKGTWGLSARSNYRKRYKFSGNVNASYLNTVVGDKALKDIPGQYSESKDFRINWTHAQDPKANMFRTFSASVNFSTSRANLHDIQRLYSREASNNTKSSSVNITQRFPDSPWSLSASMNINQVSRDSTISATLPNVSITMNRIYPFKRKVMVGAERWYEKISMSYSGEFRNSISTKENRFFQSNLVRDWQNGMRHSIPVSATFSLFDVIQISPSINYTERWYTGGIKEAWDPVARRNVTVDTIHGFKRIYDYGASLSANTKLYGMYVPWKMFGDKIQAIRHVFTPSISLSYRPDFGDPRYGFYEKYTYRNEFGDEVEYSYSPYSRMMFGTAPTGQSGSIGFDFKNNLEMKVKSESDTTGFKKISLIDDLGVNFSYNMMADSMKWSMINTNVRLKLSKSYTLSLNATWDPYMYELDKNDRPVAVDKLRIFNGKGFGKLQSTGTSFSYSLNQDTFKKLFGRGDDDDTGSPGEDEAANNNLPDDGTIGRNPHEEGPRQSVFDTGSQSMGEFDDDGYLKNQIQWNLSFNYSVRYGYDMQNFDRERMDYRGMLTHSLGLSGSIQPTKNWNFTFNTDYNFDLKKVTSINCSLTRNLHCWSMSASFIPIGPYKSYNFTIRANASMLQDLKYDQRSSPYDRGMDWY